jgi:hypothetical protein
MSPAAIELAKWLTVRAQVILLERQAIDAAAKILNTETPRPSRRIAVRCGCGVLIITIKGKFRPDD